MSSSNNAPSPRSSRRHGRSPSQFAMDLVKEIPSEAKVIDARFGDVVEPVEEACTEYKANLFRKGFCMNCMKKHDVARDGSVSPTKTFVKIHVPPTSPHAAHAELNPSALPQNSALSKALRQAREASVARCKNIQTLSAKAQTLLQELHNPTLNAQLVEAKLAQLEDELARLDVIA
ncbi:hypothetical protein AC1031_015053 [Aphanomyces cochlioides]|nr:hypothetical protein AC1031_015053 [Aphanomyces cochlioides]